LVHHDKTVTVKLAFGQHSVWSRNSIYNTDGI